MGQQFSQIVNSELNNFKPKKSIECLEDINYECPNTLQLKLYEISISSGDLRRMSNTWRIREFYIPQFNVGINNEHYGGKSYNIITNAYNRYHKEENNNDTRSYGEPPKLIETFFLNKITNKNEIEELFNVIKCHIISANAEQTITKLFELSK